MRKNETKINETIFVQILQSNNKRKRKRKHCNMSANTPMNLYEKRKRWLTKRCLCEYYDQLIGENENESKQNNMSADDKFIRKNENEDKRNSV